MDDVASQVGLDQGRCLSKPLVPQFREESGPTVEPPGSLDLQG